MTRPEIKKVEKSDSALELTLSFPANADYFDGHFAGATILPGVAQIHWAITLAAEYLNFEPIIKQMTSVKFSHVIKPDTDVILKIEYAAEKKRVKYAYYQDDGEKYSSGVFVLSD